MSLNQGGSCQSPPGRVQSASGTVVTDPRVLRDITDGDPGVDNLGGSVGVCTEGTGECQDEDPAPKQGWLVGETMLLVAGCCSVGDWRR